MAYEIEFEFDAEGQGEFKASGNVAKLVTDALKRDDMTRAESLLAASDSEVGDILIDEAESGASQQMWKRLAKLFGSVRDPERAARCAEAVNDPEMAASFYEDAYDWLKAAETYKKAGIDLRAAAMYERGLYFEKAAAIYLAKKDHLRAANCFAKYGAYYHAGFLYMKAARYEQAVAMLQKVGRTQQYFIEASTLLGRFFESTENNAMAVERYSEAVNAKPISENTVDLHHRLAVLLTKEGRLEKAEELWRAVLTVDPKHQGAKDSLKLLSGQHPTLRDPEPQRTSSKPPMASLAPPKASMAPPKASMAPPAQDAQPDIGSPPPLVLPGDEPVRTVESAPVNAALDAPKEAPEPEQPVLADAPEISIPAPDATPEPHSLGEITPPPRTDRPESVVVMREDFDVFRALPVFAQLSLDELRTVHTLADRVSFRPGEIVIEADSVGEALYVIAEGKIKVELISQKQVLEVVTMSQGATVGEMSFLDEAPASARVTALTPVTAYRFPSDRLRVHMDTDPRAGFKIIRVLGRILSIRLREANLTMLG